MILIFNQGAPQPGICSRTIVHGGRTLLRTRSHCVLLFPAYFNILAICHADFIIGSWIGTNAVPSETYLPMPKLFVPFGSFFDSFQMVIRNKLYLWNASGEPVVLAFVFLSIPPKSCVRHEKNEPIVLQQYDKPSDNETETCVTINCNLFSSFVRSRMISSSSSRSWVYSACRSFVSCFCRVKQYSNQNFQMNSFVALEN